MTIKNPRWHICVGDQTLAMHKNIHLLMQAERGGGENKTNV